MSESAARLEAELRRLQDGPRPEENPGGLGTVRFLARYPAGGHDLLNKVTSVLKVLDEGSRNGWPTEEQWALILPEWFVSACAPKITPEQGERWLAWWKSLPPDEQARVESEKQWSLDNWLYWMEPSNRQWYWWDAKVLDGLDHLIVAIEVDAWPFPWGALRWLFKAAGASALDPEE